MGDTKTTQRTESTQTQTRTPAPLTAEQQAVNRMATGTLTDYETRLKDYFGGPQYATTQQVGGVAQQRLLDRLNGTAPLLSPQEEAYLNQAYKGPQENAMAALQRSADQAAAMRGMTRADSPIGNSFLEQMRQLGVDYGSQRAQAGLNLGQQNFQQYSSAAQLAESIRQQVMQQQMQLQQGAAGLQNQFEQQRLALAPVTTTGTNVTRGTQSMPWSQGFANIAGGVNNLAGGLMGSTDKYGNTSGGLLNLVPGGAKGIQNSIGAGGEFLWDSTLKGLNGIPGLGSKGPTQLSGPGSPGYNNTFLQGPQPPQISGNYTRPPTSWFS